jgi:hypothetical protein
MPNRSKKRLLFVDSNIFLDFYRAQTDVGVKLLERLSDLPPGTVITNYQVEVEVLRNRQKVMLGFVDELEHCARSFTPPTFIAAKCSKLLKLVTAARTESERVREKLIAAVDNPKHDPILATLQRLFSTDSPVNLRRNDPIRREIKQRALTRFQLGYPPRKSGDTSIGDAFNWEWIVECIMKQKRDAIIVSRDTDYGCTIRGQTYLNHWLVCELRDRTKRRRAIRLVDRLSKALKLLDIPVTPAEATGEDRIVAAAPSNTVSTDFLLRWLENMKKMRPSADWLEAHLAREEAALLEAGVHGTGLGDLLNPPAATEAQKQTGSTQPPGKPAAPSSSPKSSGV